MRTAMVPALVMGLLISVPAMAQQGQSEKQQGQQTQSMQGMKQNGDQGNVKWDRQSVRTQLEKAGFSNVKVLDTTFLVSAEVHGGQEVLMVVNPPPSASASGAMKGSSGMMGSGGSSKSGSGDSKQ